MSRFRNGLCAAAFQCILGLITCCAGFSAGAATPATSLCAHEPPEIGALDPSVTDATISEVTTGSLDSRFTGTSLKEQVARGEVLWLRVASRESFGRGDIPIIVAHAGMLHGIQVYAAGSGEALPPAARIPEFAGARDTAFLLPAGVVSVQRLPP